VDTSKENIEGWFKSGVCAVGMGSKLVTKSIMDNKQYEELTEATKKVLDIIRDCKK
jgi:2-dehydro-3-deoxyphosphogluconate aldolase/(4S)-4-hydroxy-2-oxoglutarate aldolase